MIALETVDLELELAELFARMLQIPLNVGESVYMTPKSDQVRIEVLRSGAHAVSPNPKRDPKSELEVQKRSALKKVIDLATRAQASINYRHRTMHDDWGFDPDHNEIRRITVDGKLGRTPTLIPINDLKKQIEITRKLIDDVVALAKEFKDNPPLMVSLARSKPAGTKR
jgi:hypothetical protein